MLLDGGRNVSGRFLALITVISIFSFQAFVLGSGAVSGAGPEVESRPDKRRSAGSFLEDVRAGKSSRREPSCRELLCRTFLGRNSRLRGGSRGARPKSPFENYFLRPQNAEFSPERGQNAGISALMSVA